MNNQRKMVIAKRQYGNESQSNIIEMAAKAAKSYQ
jgi:hypothetical protein